MDRRLFLRNGIGGLAGITILSIPFVKNLGAYKKKILITAQQVPMNDSWQSSLAVFDFKTNAYKLIKESLGFVFHGITPVYKEKENMVFLTEKWGNNYSLVDIDKNEILIREKIPSELMLTGHSVFYLNYLIMGAIVNDSGGTQHGLGKLIIKDLYSKKINTIRDSYGYQPHDIKIKDNKLIIAHVGGENPNDTQRRSCISAKAF